MTKLLKKLLSPLALTGLLLASGSSAVGQERNILQEVLDRGTLRIAIQGATPPYAVIQPNGEPVGYEIDMGIMIADALGVEPEWVIIDTPGRVTALQTGKADITIANFTANFERSKVISFTDPYMVVGMVYFVLADRDDIQSVDDLNTPNMKVGFGRGSTQEKLVPAATPEVSIVRFSGMADTLEALNSGRIDGSALDNIGTSGILADNPGKYKELEGRFSREDISLGLPKGDHEWWRLLNIWMRDFNLSGKNDALYQKWFGSNRPSIFESW